MTLLKKFKTPFGSIRVTRDADGTLAYYQNGCFHSQATARGVSVCAYVHVAYQIICQNNAKKVLIIGCGGGTLATMLSRLGVHVTVVDINPVAFEIAQEFFQMPDDVVCIQRNGLTFVRKTAQRFDAVVIDVFGAHNNVPHGFTTTGFLGCVKHMLRRGGVLLMNVINKEIKDQRADAIAKNVGAAGMSPSLYEWAKERHHNVIVVGGSVKRVSIPSGKMPVSIRKELKKLVHRKPIS
ncbi:MAG: fused MFS/spermidine synthase [Alphaproteobacteria bacterium]|nr:fused MFS/spermidine synthase [Alphaproteobacteria bacterium]